MSGNAEAKKVSVIAVIGLLAVCAPIGQRAHAQQGPSGHITTCTEASIDVAAASPEEQRLACSAAGEALNLLGRCDIALKRTLHLEISKVVHNPFGTPIFGRFDIGQEVIFLTQFAGMASLIDGTPYDAISKTDFYKSLVVHEVIHGVMHQNYKRQPTSRAADEYTAYALQLASLPPVARDTLLAKVNDKMGGSALLFNDFILAFDPFYFAARAYEHFTASRDGCKNVHALLEGEVNFVATLY